MFKKVLSVALLGLTLVASALPLYAATGSIDDYNTVSHRGHSGGHGGGQGGGGQGGGHGGGHR